MLTTFLHSGTSEVSVSFFCSSASSSLLSLGPFFCSNPQKHMIAFLKKPGSSSSSVREENQWGKSACVCVHAQRKAYMLCLGCICGKYRLFPFCLHRHHHRSIHPVQGPPSPLCYSSGPNTDDIARQHKEHKTWIPLFMKLVTAVSPSDCLK